MPLQKLTDTGVNYQPQEYLKSPWNLVNLAEYPITSPDTPQYRRLIDSCLEQLRTSGYCLLQNFLTRKAVELMAGEASELKAVAFHNTLIGNAYLTPDDPSLPEEDPRRIQDTTALGAIAFDQIPEHNLIRSLYLWDGLLDFLSEALGRGRLYRYADPLGALTLAVMKEGDHLRWHFDQTDFVVSMLLQDCEAGGRYQVFPMTRSTDNENYGRVKEILGGSTEGMMELEIKPGCLVLFEGRNSLHRVTEVKGETDRLIALLGYDTKPEVVSNDYLKMIRYGRVR